MTLRKFSCSDFRCLRSIELELDSRYNLIYGANASGKTSVLEAIAYLGRGKSFRGAAVEGLVRNGTCEFLLFGRLAGESADSRAQSLGVRNGREGLEISVDGDRGGGAAALAQVLPLQVIDPDVHNLVAGGPEERRRYLDWMAFHVEPDYLDLWRRFRRALKQRNAALRQESGARVLDGWDREFGDLALGVHAARERVLERVRDRLLETGMRLLGSEPGFDYQRGWGPEPLHEALRSGRERDVQVGSTRAGPHHADLRLSYDARQARKRVSRGQQKLLACTLIVAATEVVQTHLERPLLLLLDDPTAELDAGSLVRLMSSVAGLGSQVIATALVADRGLFPEPPRTFHVEQGVVTPLD